MRKKKAFTPNPDEVPTARKLFCSCVLDTPEQEMLEKNFFGSIKLKNGTSKTTECRRLDDLNNLVLQILPCATALQVMDVAVSSGISTLEWMESFERTGVSYAMTAGDYSLNAFLFCLGNELAVLVDKHGFPLQFDVFGHALPNPPGGVNWAKYWVPLLLLKAALRISFVDARDALKNSGSEFRAPLNIRCSPVALVSPRLRSCANITLIEDDILRDDGFKRRFHVIRAANILNKAYFDRDILQKMLSNLRSRLLPEGLLAVCRTESSGCNHASVFLLDGERFRVIRRLGAGSEIEELALNLPGPIINA